MLDALLEGDESTLESLRLTEEEHNCVVWLELPASAPEVNFPVDFAWSNIQRRNRRALDRILPIYTKRDLGFRRAECRGPAKAFDTFEVLTDCWVVFESGTSGGVYEGQLFKEVLVRGGGHKIFRFYDDEPRRYLGGDAG